VLLGFKNYCLLWKEQVQEKFNIWVNQTTFLTVYKSPILLSCELLSYSCYREADSAIPYKSKQTECKRYDLHKKYVSKQLIWV
jgi:hypothetical protein